MSDDLAGRLIQLIQSEIALDADDLDADTDLLLTGLVDSLGIIQIVNWIEDELDVDVDPGDVTLENFQTVARMVTYVEQRQENAA